MDQRQLVRHAGPAARPGPRTGLDPALHDPAYDPDRRAACPDCYLPVGVRWGRLDRHVVTVPPGADPTTWRDPLDGVRASPLRADGYCTGTDSVVPA